MSGNRHYDSLCDGLARHAAGGIAVAFSGGVDSTVLLAVLREMRERAPFRLEALTQHAELHREGELIEARRIAEAWGVPLRCFSVDLLAIPEVRHNAPERCYACKRALFTHFREYATQQGLATLMDGTNADDLRAHRPGRRAALDLGVVSPLADCGLTKDDIRALAKDLGLSVASAPATPCLATRFPYNTELTPDLLRRVAEGEDILRHHLPATCNLRLRVHGALGRIEVDPEHLAALLPHAETIAADLRRLGFAPATLDLSGFRSGSMDL